MAVFVDGHEVLDRPVITTYAELRGASPDYRARETDQVAPAGMWRWRYEGDVAILQRATVADWSAAEDWITADKPGEQLIIGKGLVLTTEDAVVGVTTILTLDHNTTGVVAAGLGTGLDFAIETSTTDSVLAGSIDVVWTDVTHATRTSDMVFYTVNSGVTTEMLRLDGSRAAVLINTAAPTLEFRDSDEADPVGSYRIRVTGANLDVAMARTADFATVTWLYSLSHVNKSIVMYANDGAGNDWNFNFIAGDTAGSQALFDIGGVSSATHAGIGMTIGNSAGANVGRFTLTNFAATAIATWSNVTSHFNGIIQVDPPYAGTHLDFQLETTWTGGTLVRMDFGAATTLASSVVGIGIDFNSNVVATSEQDVYALDISLPTMTVDNASPTVKALDISSGAVVQTTGGTTTHVLLELGMPAITQTAGTVRSYGLRITPGAYTSGTQVGILFSSDPNDGALSSLAGLTINVATGESFDISINNVKEIDYATGALAFQQATTISTTAGDLTLSPATEVEIVHAAYDASWLILRDTADVSHGLTDIVVADAFFRVQKAFSAVNGGGAVLDGFGDTDSLGIGVLFRGYTTAALDTTKSSAGRAAMELHGYHGAGTGVANATAGGNVFGVRTYKGGAYATILIVDEDGNVHIEGGIKALSAVEIGIQVTQAALTVGSEGSLIAPYYAAATAIGTDALFGNLDGAIGILHDTTPGADTIEVRVNGAWLSVAVAGELFQSKVPYYGFGWTHENQLSVDDGRTYVNESLCAVCGERIDPKEQRAAVFWPNAINEKGVHSIYGHLHLEREPRFSELEDRVEALKQAVDILEKENKSLKERIGSGV